jgi:hypothetical protein
MGSFTLSLYFHFARSGMVDFYMGIRRTSSNATARGLIKVIGLTPFVVYLTLLSLSIPNKGGKFNGTRRASFWKRPEIGSRPQEG